MQDEQEVVLYLDSRSANVIVDAQLQKLLPRQRLYINLLHLSKLIQLNINATKARRLITLRWALVAAPAGRPALHVPC